MWLVEPLHAIYMWPLIASIFIGRTVAEAEVPILWPPYVKSQFIGKDPDAGKD